MSDQTVYRTIKVTAEEFTIIDELIGELSEERGNTKLRAPGAILEAVTFFKKWRKRAAELEAQ